MLSIAPLTNGNYHQYLAGSYYSGEQQHGEWVGTGAERLGLTGRVTGKHFRRLFDGFDKDNKKLVQNAGKKPDPVTLKGGRQPGWDLTFSAPKSVSTIWAVGDPTTRRAIEQCHRGAVLAALAYVEREAGRTRSDKGGKSVEPCGLVVARYQHGTSRELDPQLHDHCVIMNVGVTFADGKTRALKSQELYDHKMAAGSVYRETLARLLRELGYTLVPDGHAFHISGVPEKLVHEFSKRREQIVEKLRSWGADTAAAAGAAAKLTKKPKEVHPTPELFEAWKGIAQEFGFTPEQARQLIRTNGPEAQPARHQHQEQAERQDRGRSTVETSTPERERPHEPTEERDPRWEELRRMFPEDIAAEVYDFEQAEEWHQRRPAVEPEPVRPHEPTGERREQASPDIEPDHEGHDSIRERLPVESTIAEGPVRDAAGRLLAGAEQTAAPVPPLDPTWGVSRKPVAGIDTEDPVPVTGVERTQAAAAVSDAVKRLLDSHAHFSKRELLREAQRPPLDVNGPADRAHPNRPAALREAIDRELEKASYIYLGLDPSQVRYTTRDVWKVEASLLTAAEKLHQEQGFGVSPKKLSKIIGKQFPLSGQTPDDLARNIDQRAAVEHLTKPERLSMLTGKAGTGKSTVLKACRQAWEHAGYEVVGVAVAGAAAKSLEKSSGIKSETLARRLLQLEPKSLAATVWHHTKQIARTAINEAHRTITEALPHNRNRPRQPNLLRVYRNRSRFRLGPKTVVVLDEAGMVGTRQLEKLLGHVQRAGSKLVLVGDAAQLQPIEAGGPFRSLTERLGSAALSHITRQKLDLDDKLPEWRRQAVKDFAAGQSFRGFRAYSERGFFHRLHEPAAKLVADWVAAGGLVRPEKLLILATTNDDVRKLNALCQRVRLSQGGKEPLFGGVVRDSEVILPGDRVVFTEKNRSLGIDNGNLGTVQAVTGLPGLRKFTVKLDSGEAVTIDPRKFDGFRLGYAVTTHKAQGATCDRAFVLLGGWMQDMHMTYVQASRAREETRFYSDMLNDWQARPSLDRSKTLAHDVHDGLGPIPAIT